MTYGVLVWEEFRLNVCACDSLEEKLKGCEDN